MRAFVNGSHAGWGGALPAHMTMTSMGSLLRLSARRSSSTRVGTVLAVRRGSVTGAYRPRSSERQIVAANGIYKSELIAPIAMKQGGLASQLQIFLFLFFNL